MKALKNAGVRIILAPLQDGKTIYLPDALQLLHDEGLTSILVEGGSTVQGSFFDARLVDKIYAFVGANWSTSVESSGMMAASAPLAMAEF